jgi:2-hydroxychromene-2-carboxylate isomerase
MGLRTTLRATIIQAYLGGASPVRRGLAESARRLRRQPRRVTLFHQVEDPHSFLALQGLSALKARLSHRSVHELELRVVPVGAPAVDLTPEIERRRAWARRDARELAAHWALAAPWDADLDADLVTRANGIMLVSRAADAELEVASLVTEALWRGDRERMADIERTRGSVARSVIGEALAHRGRGLAGSGAHLGGMFRFAGNWYWGVDRLHHLVRDLERDQEIEIGSPLSPDTKAPPSLAEVSRRPPAGTPIELFYSFRSPYSYLALGRVSDIAERAGAPLVIHPVLPMVMRNLGVPWSKRLFIANDAKREADWLGIPFGKICDPVGPGAERCLAVFELASAKGVAVELCLSAGLGIWAEGRDVATDPGLRFVVERAGLSWDDAKAALADDGWRARAAARREDLLGMGLWGVPSFRCGEQCGWGQDRLPMLERALGLAPGTGDASRRSALPAIGSARPRR